MAAPTGTKCPWALLSYTILCGFAVCASYGEFPLTKKYNNNRRKEGITAVCATPSRQKDLGRIGFGQRFVADVVT